MYSSQIHLVNAKLYLCPNEDLSSKSINYSNSCIFFITAENYVLTAAHCIATNKNGPVQNVEVILGAHEIRANESSQVRLTSTEFFHHEQYDSQSITNDIGLVKLPQSVTQSKYLIIVRVGISMYYISKYLLTDTRKNSLRLIDNK